MNDTYLEEALRLFEKPKQAPAMTYQQEQQLMLENYHVWRVKRNEIGVTSPVYSQLRTYRGTALTDVMCQ
jgi:hypothetical protein